MPTQLIFVLGVLVTFAALGFAMSQSIKKHNKRMTAIKKKKGRNKYMPQVKNPGRR